MEYELHFDAGRKDSDCDVILSLPVKELPEIEISSDCAQHRITHLSAIEGAATFEWNNIIKMED